MESSNDLTRGSITKTLFKLAIPIMGTSFVQMAYNMIDMIWVGRLGTEAVAAVGTAGFFTWLGSAFILIPKIGAEVGVAQSVGSNNKKEVDSYIKNSIQIVISLAIVYALVLIVFRNGLVGFFNLGDEKIIQNTITYLIIVSCGFIFYFINPVFTAIFNGYGDSKTPFYINSAGLVINVILDPILIFGLGPIPRLAVSGAAIATVIAQVIVTLLFVIEVKKRREIFADIHLLQKPDMKHIKRIVRLGFPSAVQSGLFSIIAMVLARIIAHWGSTPIAVQKVGSQIEAISWMTAGGFQTAMSAFTGQNYGANKKERVVKGYMVGIAIVSFIGIFATILLYFGAGPLFNIFVQEEEAIQLGIQYLKILAVSQLFMCVEITTAGAFNGLGNTIPPSVVGVLFNALRIPAAIWLSSTILGLNGIWWAISISSIFKGSVLVIWYIILLKRKWSVQ